MKQRRNQGLEVGQSVAASAQNDYGQSQPFDTLLKREIAIDRYESIEPTSGPR
jgi:hypothetical protein